MFLLPRERRCFLPRPRRAQPRPSPGVRGGAALLLVLLGFALLLVQLWMVLVLVL